MFCARGLSASTAALRPSGERAGVGVPGLLGPTRCVRGGLPADLPRAQEEREEEMSMCHSFTVLRIGASVGLICGRNWSKVEILCSSKHRAPQTLSLYDSDMKEHEDSITNIINETDTHWSFVIGTTYLTPETPLYHFSQTLSALIVMVSFFS